MSKSDPTNMRRTRIKATKLLEKRLNDSEARVKAVFRSISRTRRTRIDITNNASFYDYDLTPLELRQLALEVQSILDQELLLSGGTIPSYYEPVVELPQRAGTLDEAVNFNKLILAAGATGILIKGRKVLPIDVPSTITGTAYQSKLGKAYQAAFAMIKTLSNETASQVSTQLNLGMKGRLSPTKIKAAITDRFNVSRSSAAKKAGTHVNEVYTTARLVASTTISKDTGLKAAVLHRSALTSTTRTHHAARHGKVYTQEQQEAWWSEGANRINCRCNTESVLVSNGGSVVDKSSQQKIQTEGVEFFQ